VNRPRRICLHGPESVGKSTLAGALAGHFGTIAVPEYGRTYCEKHGVELTAGQLVEIGIEQTRLARAAEAGRDWLVLDTDALMTSVWSDMMLGTRDPWFATFDDFADLYLLCDIDLPWVDDGVRIYGGADERGRFFEACRAELDARGVRWALVSGQGPARFANALAAIAALA
jgi:NadR type nicotinamide-nucleotide adenylyltransferase